MYRYAGRDCSERSSVGYPISAVSLHTRSVGKRKRGVAGLLDMIPVHFLDGTNPKILALGTFMECHSLREVSYIITWIVKCSADVDIILSHQNRR